MSEPRLFRVIVLGGASLVGSATLAVICDACGSGETAGPDCGAPFVELSSPCGFSSVTTTCAGGPARCEDSGAEYCGIGPVTSDCGVTVTLGDETTHTFPVTVGPDRCAGNSLIVTSPGVINLTCAPTDAGPDADAAANDASSDASSDAADAD